MSATEKRAAGTVSERDKERMRRFAESCKEAEIEELVEGEDLKALTRWVNKRRAEIGMPLFEVDNDDLENPPELGFHRRARALGLVGSGRPNREPTD